MRKYIVITILLVLVPFAMRADEGMWLISKIESIYPQMKARGLIIDAEDIFSQTRPAIYNAVVWHSGGGTGSIISDKGLMITNHHVAYGDIHSLSTPEHNYLKDGFWATDRSGELPVAGTSVTFVRKIVDVTKQAQHIRDSLLNAGSGLGLGGMKVLGAVAGSYQDKLDPSYELDCVSFFGGELYLLFCNEVYNDVRLVGAPPERIGAFGGEQDNWGWPQHKGDFALYRIYGDQNGKPADYSPENVPIKPAKVLNVSTAGVLDGDYTMVVGFPGSTHRTKSSFYVEEKRTVTNAVGSRMKRSKLDILKRHMERDPDVRLRYANHYFGVSNSADNAKWESICLRRYDVAGIRAQEEAELQRWIDADPERTERWGTLMEELRKGYEARAEVQREQAYYRETYFHPSLYMIIANRVSGLARTAQRFDKAKVTVNESNSRGFFINTNKDYDMMDPVADREIMVTMLGEFTRNIPRELWGDYLSEKYDEYGGDFKALVDYAVDNSHLKDKQSLTAFIGGEPTVEQVLADPLAALANSIRWERFTDRSNNVERRLGFKVNHKENEYARAIYAMREDKGIPQYPNANLTMRVTYGNVGGIKPADGITYDYYSTINGYVEKYNPEDYEFDVDQRMLSLIADKDWGRWGAGDQMRVNFLSNNDITGGNSGSPVLNAHGDVVGLAFDGNRESMACDLYFHPEFAKTVSVDIRFVLWVIEKYAGAGTLIDEMKLVN